MAEIPIQERAELIEALLKDGEIYLIPSKAGVCLLSIENGYFTGLYYDTVEEAVDEWLRKKFSGSVLSKRQWKHG